MNRNSKRCKSSTSSSLMNLLGKVQGTKMKRLSDFFSHNSELQIRNSIGLSEQKLWFFDPDKQIIAKSTHFTT
jgi:hypothetical protein